MGSQYSSGRRDPKKINLQKEAQKEYLNENKSQRKHAFVWKINGFKSLLDMGEAWTTTALIMQGFAWNLSMNPMDRKIGDTSSEKHMSLRLGAALSSISTDDMLETKFKFFIHNQKEGKHIEREASHTYMTTSYTLALCMIPLETLKSPSLGFLVNDSIEVGVEIIEIKKLEWTSCSILKNKSNGLFSWYIDDFSQLSRPIALSKPFQIAGYTWILSLQPESVVHKNYVGLYLQMENKSGSQLPPSSGVLVQAIFYIKRQSQGILTDDPLGNKTLDPYQHKFCCNFTPSSTIWGFSRFMRLEDFKNPSNGYLIKGTCTIEASVCIFGTENDVST